MTSEFNFIVLIFRLDVFLLFLLSVLTMHSYVCTKLVISKSNDYQNKKLLVSEIKQSIKYVTKIEKKKTNIRINKSSKFHHIPNEYRFNTTAHFVP